VLFVASLLCMFSAPLLRADQFDYIPRSLATNALNYVPEDSIVISYCSQCDQQRVEIWRVKHAFVSDVQYEDLFQLTLFAKKLFRSKKAINYWDYSNPLKFEKVRGEKSLGVEGVDLAYIYVRKPDGSFRVLAKEMNLDPLRCAVEKITLPAAVAKKLKD